MRSTALALMLLMPALVVAQGPANPRRDRLLELYRGEAIGYAIFRDPSRKEKVELRRDPVYTWTNPIRGGEQDGDVFVWTCRGRAEVVGTFFSYPSTGPRNLNHELHSLSTATLDVTRPGGANAWTPKAPGVEPRPIEGASSPARSPAQRLLQMRELTRSFTASSEDFQGKRWELRLLPQPLYRYESTDPDVLDGALFAFVTSAGTDPEVLLVIEARKPSPTASPGWHYAIARFSDLTLAVRRDGKEVFNAPPIPHDSPDQDPQQRYRTFRDRGIPPIEGENPPKPAEGGNPLKPRSDIGIGPSILALALVARLPSDDAPKVESKVEADRASAAVELARAEAGRYRIKLSDPSRGPVAIEPEALLRWSSPSAGSIHGSVFVWADRGGPVAISSIYKWSSPNTHLGVELHALAPGIASADRDGVRAWVPGPTAPDRKAIADAPKPADSPSGRLRQMRALAQEFNGSGTLRDGSARNLRLLTQPIYRYRGEGPDLIDGALFAFVEGTDPEIILVIEASKAPGGPEWRFAAARMNSITLRLAHKGREVWTAPVLPWGQARNHNQPYTLFMFGNDPGMTFDGP